MKRNWFHLLGPLVLATSLSGPTGSLAAENSGNPFREALAQVNSQCPERYPDTVVPLPEEGELLERSTADLMGMLESWNPALRTAAAAGLGARGDATIPTLRKGTRSDNWMVRAGSTAALAAIMKQKLGNWQEYHPELGDARQAQEKIREEHADLGDEFIRLTKDPRLEVRVAALGGLSTFAPQTPAAATAVLQLCADRDPYLAQDAMITLEKKFGVDAIQQDAVIAALKEAMRAPLPRGRGHVVRLITRMDEKAQRQFIPVLLDHLDWQPNRDTMFGAGGQEESVRILTELKVKELVPRIPKLMTKTMRGPGLFDPCLESARTFGKDAKGILPELRSMLGEIEQEFEKADQRQRAGLEPRLKSLRETVAFLEDV